MPDMDTMKFAEAVDETIDRLETKVFNLKRGLTNSIVWDDLAQTYAPLIVRLGQQLARERGLNVIADHLRDRESLAIHAAAGTRQLSLFGIPDGITEKLPARLTIPGEKTNQEARHKLVKYTLKSEFQRYFNLLKKQREADEIRYEAVRFIYTVIEAQPDDLTVPEACKRAGKGGGSSPPTPEPPIHPGLM